MQEPSKEGRKFIRDTYRFEFRKVCAQIKLGDGKLSMKLSEINVVIRYNNGELFATNKFHNVIALGTAEKQFINYYLKLYEEELVRYARH